MDKLVLAVGKDEKGERLDSFLARKTKKQSRAYLQKVIDENFAKVNDKVAKKNYRVKEGDKVELSLPEPRKVDLRPQDIPLEIVYEDSDLLVVNKTAGMVVHPAAGNHDGTLVNALLAHCDCLSLINGEYRPGIVHRIDKDTSGLLVVAKNEDTHRGLSEQFKEHSITRKYIGLVMGSIKENEGIVDAPIGRHPVHRKKMAVIAKNSKNAITHFRVLKRFSGYTLVEARLETGRTHQIRVHMAYIGYPLVGDQVYGKAGNELGVEGQLLHAAILGFIHPIKKEYMKFEVPLSEQFQGVLKKLDNFPQNTQYNNMKI